MDRSMMHEKLNEMKETLADFAVDCDGAGLGEVASMMDDAYVKLREIQIALLGRGVL